MCGKTDGKILTVWCDGLWSVGPQQDMLGNRKGTKKGK